MHQKKAGLFPILGGFSWTFLSVNIYAVYDKSLDSAGLPWEGNSTPTPIPFPQDFCGGSPYGDPHRRKSYSHFHPIPIPTATLLDYPPKSWTVGMYAFQD